MKRNLQSSTILQEKCNRILSSKNNLIHDVESKKGRSSNRKYNLRLREKPEKQNEDHLKNGSLTKLKILPSKNTINEVTRDIYMKPPSVKNKENKRIQSQSRRSIKTNICPNFEFSSNFIKESNKVLEDGNKISTSKNLNKNVNLYSNQKRFEALSANVNLNEALDHEKNCEEKNLITNKIEAKHDIVANNAKTIPIWRRNLSTNLSKQSKKRKGVDIYDISKDEDILSNEKNGTKSKKNQTKTTKKLNGFIKDRKMPLLSNGRTKVIKKSSSTSKPLQTKKIKLNIDQPMSNEIPIETKVAELNKCYQLQENLNKIQNVNINIQSNNIQNEQIKSNVGQLVFNEISNKSEMKALDTCHQLPENSNKIQNIETNVQNNNILTSEVSSSFDEIHPETETRSNNETLLMTVADEFEQSVLVPKMTSTPDPTVLIKTKNQLQINLKKLDVSHIVSKDRQCLKTVNKVQKLLSTNKKKVKKSDIPLFESPSKKPKQKANFKFKAPKNYIIQIDSMEGFSSSSSVENAEDSLIKPKKAYHTPDAKVHIARIKRTSEIMRDGIKKSKEDLLIEKLSDHFAEISSTELCIE